MKKIISGVTVITAILLILMIPRLRSEDQKNTFVLGNVADFSPGSIQVVAAAKVLVISDNEGIYAISAVCPHKGCLIRKENQGLVCPCHAAQFDLNGKVLKGPARTDLVWYLVEKNQEGKLILNTSKPVAKGTKLKTNP